MLINLAIIVLIGFIVLFILSRLFIGRDDRTNSRTYPHNGGMHEHFTNQK